MIIDSLENKQKILREFLQCSAMLGWNNYALSEAIINAELEEKYLSLIFPNGVFDVIRFFSNEVNIQMSDILNSSNLDQMKIRDKIKFAVKTHLQNNINNKKSLEKLTRFFSDPKNIIFGLRLCYKTSDLIWYTIGDKSTDFNFYTKRLILSKVYVRTLLFFVNDKSDSLDKTLDFLDTEIEKVMKIQSLKMKVASYNAQIFTKINDLSKDSLGQTFGQAFKKLPFIRLFNKNIFKNG